MYYDDETIIYLDGKFVKAKDASADLYGQSLHYGYAAFEGIRSYKTEAGTKIFKSEEHFERLKNSCHCVYIPYDWSTDEVTKISYELLQKNGLENAYIRPLVFCPPHMTLEKAKGSHLLIAVWDWASYLGEKLLKIGLSSFQRPNPKAFLMHAKISGHYVNSIMASQEMKDKGYDEALLLDNEGNVAEGPGANVFYEKDGALFTPELGHILPGITRASVIEISHIHNIPVTEKKISIEELKAADAVFYCGTAAEVIGWESLDGIGFAKPWADSVSKKIQNAYKELVLGK